MVRGLKSNVLYDSQRQLMILVLSVKTLYLFSFPTSFGCFVAYPRPGISSEPQLQPRLHCRDATDPVVPQQELPLYHFFFFLFKITFVTYGIPGLGVESGVAAVLYHSHSIPVALGSKPHVHPTLQLAAHQILNPLCEARDQTISLVKFFTC